MTINLSEILSRENYTIQKEVTADFNVFSCQTGEFPIREKSPFTICLTHRKKASVR